MRGRRPSRTVPDPTAVRLRVGHTLTVTETALAFLEDARCRSELCRPLDWIPEVYHPIGSGEAVIPDALLYYRRGPADGDNGSMLRAFVEVDRATVGPERLAAKPPAYERLHRYVRTVPGRRPTLQEPGLEERRRRYPLFPPRPVRPGRHRTRRHREPGDRPACDRPAVGAVPLPARRARPRSVAGRPTQRRPLRTRMAPRPRPRPASPLDRARVSADITRGPPQHASDGADQPWSGVGAARPDPWSGSWPGPWSPRP
jgi:hypothetical protein